MKDFRLQSYLTITFQKRIICKYKCPNGRLKLFLLLYSGGRKDINILIVNKKHQVSVPVFMFDDKEEHVDFCATQLFSFQIVVMSPKNALFIYET